MMARVGFLLNYAANYAAQVLGREPTRPLIASYYLTHRCPLDCLYCSDGENAPFHADRAPELGTEDVKRLLRIVREATDVLDVTGGEPMVRADLEELLAFARSIGFTTVLNTKGIGLAERPDLVEHADILALSVESLDPDRLAAIVRRPAATARRILDGLAAGIALTRRKGRKLVVTTVVMPENLDDVLPILSFCLENGALFQVTPQLVGTLPRAELRGDPRYAAALDAVIAAKERTGRVLGAIEYLRNVRDLRAARCHPLLMAAVRPDGDLYHPCIDLKRHDENLLSHGSVASARRASAARFGPIPDCGERCQIFCHMALSLAQRSLRTGLRELRTL
jgi:MoaA/NifB/PqqE/SkfB family radical SAM enzyme